MKPKKYSFSDHREPARGKPTTKVVMVQAKI